MSFAAISALISGKKPVWLYLLRKGAEYRYFTSRGTDFVGPGADVFAQTDVFGDTNTDEFSQTYTSVPMTRTRVRTTSAIGRAEVKLVFPQSNEFARLFLGDPGYDDNEVQIFQTFEDDPDAEIVCKFRGRVVDTRAFYKTITLAAENRFTTFRRKALVDVIQRPCRHALYHGGCGLNIADFQQPATVTGLSGNVATITSSPSQADGYFSGGVLTFGTQQQFIVKQVGSSFTLLAPVPGLADEIATNGSASVQIAPGCDLSMATCEDKFDNLANYGGFPWLTDSLYDGRNPFW